MKKSKPKSLLIDDLVEADPTYKEPVLAELKEKLGDHPTKEEIVAYAESATEETFKFWNDAYFNTRKKDGCGGKGCSVVFRKNFDQYLQDGENVVFESTGVKFPGFAVDKAKASKHP